MFFPVLLFNYLTLLLMITKMSQYIVRTASLSLLSCTLRIFQSLIQGRHKWVAYIFADLTITFISVLKKPSFKQSFHTHPNIVERCQILNEFVNPSSAAIKSSVCILLEVFSDAYLLITGKNSWCQSYNIWQIHLVTQVFMVI